METETEMGLAPMVRMGEMGMGMVVTETKVTEVEVEMEMVVLTTGLVAELSMVLWTQQALLALPITIPVAQTSR